MPCPCEGGEQSSCAARGPGQHSEHSSLAETEIDGAERAAAQFARVRPLLHQLQGGVGQKQFVFTIFII